MKIYGLHGWAYSTEKWQDFQRELQDRGIELVLLNIPGLTADLDQPWDIDDYLRWLSKELPEEPTIILGHSNGGRLALNFAWVYPDRVKQLILLDSAGVYHGGLSKLKRDVFKSIAKLGKNITNSPQAKAILYKLARVNDYNEAPEHMKKVMENMLNSDKDLVLEEIKSKSSIIWGGLDKVTPLTDGVEMHKRLPKSTMRVVEEGRHSPHFTHASEVADIVKLVTK